MWAMDPDCQDKKNDFFLMLKWRLFSLVHLNNDFYGTLFVFNFIYRVSENFSAYSYDHMSNILNYIQEKLALPELPPYKSNTLEVQ